MNRLNQSWQDVENNVAQMEPDDFILPEDEDALYEQHRQRAIDEAREQAALMREDDEQIDREAREVIKAERARLASEESSSGPLGECRYNCTEAEHVGDGKYVCFKSDHWK